MTKLSIEVKTSSKGKIVGVPVPQYILYQNFEVYYIIKNISSRKDDISPNGRFRVIILWKGTDLIEEQWYDIPRLVQGKPHYTGTKEWGVLSTLGTFHITDIISDMNNLQLEFHTPEGYEITPQKVIHAIFAMSPEGVFEFWGLIIAAAGFAIIAAEKIISLIKWVLTNLIV